MKGFIKAISRATRAPTRAFDQIFTGLANDPTGIFSDNV